MISVVIVNYNAGPILTDCVAAVLKSAVPVTVLISNNGDPVQMPMTDARIRITENHANLGFSRGPMVRNMDGSEQRGCRRKIPTPLSAVTKNFNMNMEPLPNHPIDVEAISGAFMLVRRSVFDTVGAWDEGYFLHCEDLDLCMRFHLARFRIVFVPTVSVMHIKGACSTSRPLFVEWHKHKGMVRFYYKFYRDKYAWPVMGAVFIGIWLRFLLVAMRIL
jgi:GT2 family glycosyltransferase